MVLDSKDAVDKELWWTVEDLHNQNTQLLAEIAELRGGAGGESATGLIRRSSGHYRCIAAVRPAMQGGQGCLAGFSRFPWASTDQELEHGKWLCTASCR